eukprot:TRINITY_DN309_c1_g2_i1.p1 TRINITY_DN309_c1_g2~~TRINITY_DN309_c1_g2_i1.p1  ORF type:complete len:624 (+),score=155.21 TRINITY_DN309_c1_g2_i1:286-2157(+)
MSEVEEPFIIGVDFGTWETCIAYPVLSDSGEQEFRAIKPYRSTIFFKSIGEWFVGEDAIGEHCASVSRTKDKQFVSEIKRVIGKTWPQAVEKGLPDKLPYNLVKCIRRPHKDGEFKVAPGLAVQIQFEEGGSFEISLEEIVSKIIRHGVEQVREICKLSKTREIQCVVTVPAHFNDVQQEMTKQAAKIANLDCLKSLAEPVAAILGVGIDCEDGRYLVYDLGGGTFDVSLVLFGGGYSQVIGKDGDCALGGCDFNEDMLKNFKSMADFDFTDDEWLSAMPKLLKRCEEAKLLLSMNDSACFKVKIGGRKRRFDISRSTFEGLIKKRVDGTLEKLKNIVGKKDITCLLPVGGSSKIPYIQNRLKKDYSEKMLKSDRLDQLVALGACRYCVSVSGASEFGDEDLSIQDSVPLNLGVVAKDKHNREVFSVIIPRGKIMPCGGFRKFKPWADDQQKILVEVYEGLSEDPRDNFCHTKIEKFITSDKLKDDVSIIIEFEVDESGALTVFVCEETVSGTTKKRIDRLHNMTREKVEELREKAIIDNKFNHAKQIARVETELYRRRFQDLRETFQKQPPENFAKIDVIINKAKEWCRNSVSLEPIPTKEDFEAKFEEVRAAILGILSQAK